MVWGRGEGKQGAFAGKVKPLGRPGKREERGLRAAQMPTNPSLALLASWLCCGLGSSVRQSEIRGS